MSPERFTTSNEAYCVEAWLFKASTPAILTWYVPWAQSDVAVKLQEKVPFNLVPDWSPALQEATLELLGLNTVIPGLSAPARSSVTLRVTVTVWLEEVTSTDVGDKLIEL